MSCFHPFHVVTRYGQEYDVPCHWCVGCRQSYAYEWSQRLKYEAITNAQRTKSPSSFITLTYADRCLPRNGSCYKPDVDLFYKRLRQHVYRKRRADYWYNHRRDFKSFSEFVKNRELQRSFRPKIKHFTVSEYGERGRPHYHIILFGDGGTHLTEYDIKSAWRYGRVDFQPLSPKHCSYVLKYLVKQRCSKEEARIMYKPNHIAPPFKKQSPGLGSDFVKQYSNVLLSQPNAFIPKYYADKFGLDVSYRQMRVQQDELTAARKSGLSLGDYRRVTNRARELEFIRKRQNRGELVFNYYIDKRHPGYYDVHSHVPHDLSSVVKECL